MLAKSTKRRSDHDHASVLKIIFLIIIIIILVVSCFMMMVVILKEDTFVSQFVFIYLRSFVIQNKEKLIKFIYFSGIFEFFDWYQYCI